MVLFSIIMFAYSNTDRDSLYKLQCSFPFFFAIPPIPASQKMYLD